MGIRQQRVAQIIFKEVSNMIQFEIKDSALGMVTLLDVKLSSDYSYCTLYVSFLDEASDQVEQIKLLNTYAKSIRSELGKRLALRKIPQLTFVIDDTYTKAHRIDQILKSFKKD